MVPVCSSRDAQSLCDLGNVELYCGYVPTWLAECHSNGSLLESSVNNRLRISDNVTDYDELAQIANIAEQAGSDVFVALNSRTYSRRQLLEMPRYLDELISANVRNVIVSDLNLINLLSHRYPEMSITISCLAQVTNTESVRFYKALGNVRRFVVPRHMSVGEVKLMAENNRDVDFEVFVFSNKCLFDDGFCRAKHEAGQICRQRFGRQHVSLAGMLSPKDVVNREENASAYLLWTSDYTKHNYGAFRCNHFACSACAVESLSELPNMAALKLSIRGHGIAELIAQASLSNKVIGIAERGDGCEMIRNEVCSSLNCPNLCAEGFNCLMRS